MTGDAVSSDVASPSLKVKTSEEYSPGTVADLGFTGKGINIAIMDSGVDDKHADLIGKYVAGVDFLHRESAAYPRDGTYNPDDTDGHGTLCSGCALGTGAGSLGEYQGTAPDAGLIEVKVSDSGVSGALRRELVMDNDVVDAFAWVVDHKEEFDIRIVSASFGISPGGSSGGDINSMAAQRAVEAGIVVVSSAGNDGPNNYGFKGPTAADGVIAVGATYDQDTITRVDDEVTDWSSRGPRDDNRDDDPYNELKPDVVAPGDDITTTKHSVNNQRGSGYLTVDGTSFSCPFVAGIVACMLEANPDLTPSDVKLILQMAAEPRGSPYYPDYPYPHSKWNPTFGHGIADGYLSILLASNYDEGNITMPFLKPISSSDYEGTYTLEWHPLEGAERYILQDSPDPGFSEVTEVYRGTGSAYDIHDTPRGDHHYRVVVEGGEYDDEVSNMVHVNVRSRTQDLPTPEFTETYKQETDGDFTIMWTRIIEAQEYLVQVDEEPSFPSPKNVYFGTDTMENIYGATDGTYYYRVKAIASETESAWSTYLIVFVDIPNYIDGDDAGAQTDSPEEELYGNDTASGDGALITINPLAFMAIVMLVATAVYVGFRLKRG